MKWFGLVAWAPVCMPEDRIETPLGVNCIHCNEPIMFGDSGFAMPMLTGPALWRLGYEHLECFHRGLAGGPEHLLGQCGCGAYPRVEMRLPAMTRRQEALWVWSWRQKPKETVH